VGHPNLTFGSDDSVGGPWARDSSMHRVCVCARVCVCVWARDSNMHHRERDCVPFNFVERVPAPCRGPWALGSSAVENVGHAMQPWRECFFFLAVHVHEDKLTSACEGLTRLLEPVSKMTWKLCGGVPMVMGP
jgi:hypothetical protein